MNSLTPFIHHALPDRPGPSSAPEASCSRCSPPLGKQPDPTQPPGDPRHPAPSYPAGSARQSSAPGTGQRSAGRCAHDRRHPAACRQKTRRNFWPEGARCDGAICPGLFSTQQHTYSAHPAPEEDPEAVEQLVEWRENAPTAEIAGLRAKFFRKFCFTC